MKTAIWFVLVILVFGCSSISSDGFYKKYAQKVDELTQQYESLKTSDAYQEWLTDAKGLLSEMKGQYSKDLNAKSQKLYADLAFRLEEYHIAGRVYEHLVNMYSTADSLALNAAESYVFAGQYKQARPLLLSSLQNQKNSVKKQQLSTYIADDLYRQMGPDTAIVFLKTIKSQLDDDDPFRIDARLHLLGLINQKAPELKNIAKWYNSQNPVFDNKVILLDFWATWCPPCRKSLPAMKKLYQMFRDESKFVVVGLTKLYGYYRDEEKRVDKTKPDEEIKRVGDFLSREQISYPVGIAASGINMENFGVTGIPTFFLIKNDRIVHYWVGYEEQHFQQMTDQIKNHI